MEDQGFFQSIYGKGFDPSRWVTRSFNVHGVSVNVLSNSSFILESVTEFLHYFLCPEIVSKPEVQFCLFDRPLSCLDLFPALHREGVPLYDSERDDEMNISRGMKVRLKYIGWKGYYVADFEGKGIFILDLSRGAGIGFFPDPSSFDPGVFSNFVFLIGFSEILRSRELFLIHGAALARDGEGILIPGFTGGGKTTLSLSLARKGFQFLSDDRPFLRERKGGFDLLAFPEDIDVTDQTISFYPEIDGLPSHYFKTGSRKKRFRIEEVYPGSILRACHPKILLFPKIVTEEKSRLEPIHRIEAIERLLPHTLLVFEQGIARKQFHLLCRMIEEMDCYLLHFGKDVLDVHRLVEEVMG